MAGCVCAHVHILTDHVTLSISLLEKVVSCLVASLALSPKRRRLELNRLLRSFAVTRPQHRSLLFDLILPRHPFQAAYFRLRLVPLPAVSVDCLMYCPGPAMKRKKLFLARVEWLPVTSRSHTVTDKCKISILIILYS